MSTSTAGWEVREDAPTAISLGKIIAMETSGPRYDYATFEQGSPVPYSYVDPIVDRMDAAPPTDEETGVGGDHMWRFLKHVGERPALFAPVPPPPTAPPAAQTVDWSRADVTTLQAELAKRPNLTLPETGSGANGSIIKADVVKLLTEDDQAKAANPFNT